MKEENADDLCEINCKNLLWYIFGVPHWLPILSFFSIFNELGMGAGIDMSLTPCPSKIGWDSKLGPSNLSRVC